MNTKEDEDRHLSDEEYGDWDWGRMLENIDGFGHYLLQADEWGYPATAELIQSQRFVWFTSLIRCLRKFLDEPFNDEPYAQQILGYVSLRSLCEYLLKIYALVHDADYEHSDKKFKNHDGSTIPTSGLSYEQLKQTFRFLAHDGFEDYLSRVQQRGNAIHSYKNRSIGVHPDLCADIRHFAAFFHEIDCSVGRFVEDRAKLTE